MAASSLHKTRQRKMIYFGAIIVLFTVSLIHRQVFLEPQAYRLQLREQSIGEVELTGSAVRLMLTGSRGLAVTCLWYTAMDKQKRGEYHELELLVKSITKLQPYFITPWLYQSWNIAFNVAVECDRPRDKYYYISRGLELLAEGERRNRGAGKDTGEADPERVIFPGNPELRHYMGFFYQLKIGTSDERLTMRSLIELSCIDPVERDSGQFWKQEPGKRVVDMEKFRAFCYKNPRLVRRLREQLKYESPDRIVKFLDDHKAIPNRFKPIDKSKQITQSELKELMEQFPIVPLPNTKDWGKDWPDPRNREMSEKEAIDVFVLARTWYEFAQKPLPPPDDNASPQTQDYDKVRYRVPRHMVTQLFRQYPARGQIYIAETLESEGFFDSDGWEIKGWFAKGKDGDETIRVGEDPKYFSKLAWDKGFEMYREFGIENGIYLTSDEVRALNKKAELCRKELHLKPNEGPPQTIRSEWREGALGESLAAQSKLYYSEFFRRLSNFNSFFYQAEAERDAVTTAARKMIFLAEQKRNTSVPSELLLAYYDQAWMLYIQACLKFPAFAQVSSMQEDLYEIHQRYLKIGQLVHRESFSKRAVLTAKMGFYPYPIDVQPYANVLLANAKPHPATESAQGALSPMALDILRAAPLEPTRAQLEAVAAQLAYWPYPNWRETMARYHVVSIAEADAQKMSRVVPIKQRMGPLDLVEYYNAPGALQLKDALFQFTQGLGLSQHMNVASAITYPGHEYFLLSRAVGFQDRKSAGMITNVTSSAPMIVTSPEHGLHTGSVVDLSGIPSPLTANGTWTVTVIDANTFSLNGSKMPADAYASQAGVWTTYWQPLIVNETRRIAANRLGLDR